MSLFITFEGIEGAGKTSRLQALAEHLRNQNVPVTVTHEPGGCPLADGIRALSRAEAEALRLNIPRIFKKMTPFPENMSIPRLLLSLDLGAHCWHAALLSAKHTGRHAFKGMEKPEQLLSAVP